MARSAPVQGIARPSIRDVARHAGVSPACVSNVINGRRRKDDPIGRAVMEAVASLGYRRNPMAANLRSQRSRFIGLVIPDFENPFFAELVARLERRAERTDYRIVARSSHEDPEVEAREIAELADWRVAGILLIPALGSRLLIGTDTPTVVIDRVMPGAAVDCVGVDNAPACAEVMRRLAARGHRRVLVAYLGDGIANVAERLDGVRAAAQGLDVHYLPTGRSAEGARAALARWLDTHAPPDAIFCLFNPATLAAYGLLQARGLSARTALVGFDDSAWMAHVHPPVAAIAQPAEALADAAWERLTARIGGEDAPPATLRVACRLEPRGTLGDEEIGARDTAHPETGAPQKRPQPVKEETR